MRVRHHTPTSVRQREAAGMNLLRYQDAVAAALKRGYRVPAGYSVYTLVTGDDRVTAGFGGHVSAEDIAEQIASDQRWERLRGAA